MHVAKACKALWELSKAPANLDTYTKAAVLFAGLEADNADVDDGERPNETVNSKIHSARAWFEILCGIGEDGDWPEDRSREFVRSDLAGIQDHINHEIESPSSHFQKWPAVVK
jgi:hypothetical protein